MHIFLSAFDDIPDPRAENARHDLGELLVIAFVSVLCGVCAVLAPLGFCLRAEFSARSADVFALVSAQNVLTGDSPMSSL